MRLLTCTLGYLISASLIVAAVPFGDAGAVQTPTLDSQASLPGTNDWRLDNPATSGEIEGYSRAVSGPPGQPLELSISTSAPGYRAEAFRFGDYQGGQAALVWSSGQLTGLQQSSPTFSSFETRTVVADWTPSVTVPTDGWTPGVYLIKLTTSSGFDSFVPYIVRATTTSDTVALVVPVATWQAYNTWGGYSLYKGFDGDRRSWAVSFDRPFTAPGAADFFFGIKPVVRLAERIGLPLSYLANTDLDSHPGILQGADAVVSMGHDEYWTRGMRNAFTSARDEGTNVAFLGANTMYWQVRLETDDTTRPGRRVVGYKHDWKLDPLNGSNPGLVTGRWRDSPSPEPENSLTGMMYECYPADTDYRVVTPGWWGFRKTNVASGASFPNLVGIEADRVYLTDSSPHPLHILSFKTYPCRGVQTSTQSTYYTTDSGAGVFNAGTLRWTCAIYKPCGSAGLTPRTNDFVRAVTRTILTVFAKGPAGLSHPAVDNTDQFELPTDNQVSASWRGLRDH